MSTSSGPKIELPASYWVLFVIGCALALPGVVLVMIAIFKDVDRYRSEGMILCVTGTVLLSFANYRRKKLQDQAKVLLDAQPS